MLEILACAIVFKYAVNKTRGRYWTRAFLFSSVLLVHSTMAQNLL